MAREPESGLLSTIQDTTDWGVLLLLRVVVSLPLLFFGVLHLVSPAVFREILVAAGLPLVYLHSLLVPLVEILAGVLLLLGFLTRLGAVLAFGVMVPAALVTLQVTAGSDGPALPTLALPVTLAVASFFLALLGGGAGSIDARMHYQRAAPCVSAQTRTGPRAFFPRCASDTVAIVLGLLILVILMYFLWGRPSGMR
jgi:putative oxidoreductase